MIIVHDTFVCKPGNASKVAKMFKETMAKNPNMVNIMTDITGQYHRVKVPKMAEKDPIPSKN